MRDSGTLIKGFLNDTIKLNDLTPDELDSVVDELVDIANGLLDTKNHEVGVAMLNVLEEAIELRITSPDVGFEQAIVDAEKRGSVYWEFEDITIH
jgi:hypothetical protein